MTTRAPEAVKWLADQWENYMDYPSAVLSGIIGDPAHQEGGGYHISIEDQSSGNYSVTRPDDKAPPGDWSRAEAVAIDMSMSTADMKKTHSRLYALWQNRSSDHRAAYLNAYNGWDGDNGAGRYDYVSGDASGTTDDHKWHTHLEIRRRYWNDWGAMEAIATVLSAGVAPPTPQPGPEPEPPEPPEPGTYPPYGGHELTWNPSSYVADVRVWQSQMSMRGWSISGDGYFGDQTLRVVNSFQAEKNLGVDGVIGPVTWDAAWTAPIT